MILAFSTQLNRKPTYFVEKIWQGFPDQKDYLDEWFAFGKIYEGYDFHPDAYGMFPKIHSIREDKGNRWKAGMMIDFFINNRTKRAFCFAPRIQVICTQVIEIKYMSIFNSGSRYAKPFVKIDGVIIYDVAENGKDEMLKLAYNDGFESIDDFFSYFNKDFVGKIIHWTDLKY
jgi:hypothetical protein